jgi:hypothetical protein
MYNFLAESPNYKVYSHEDYVYLKKKSECRVLDEHDKTDILMSWVYGNPTSALIMHTEQYIVVAGCGLVIYDISNRLETQLLAKPDNITWTNALHQDEMDDSVLDFRYVAYSEANIPQVFKMNLLYKEAILLS